MIEPNVAARQTPMAQHDSVGRYCVGARSVRAQCVTPDMRGRRPRNLKDDHEMRRHGMVMYDALYPGATTASRKSPPGTRRLTGKLRRATHLPGAIVEDPLLAETAKFRLWSVRATRCSARRLR